MTSSSESNQIKLTRIYDAPVSAIWEAWADPAQAAQWWGPRGFTLTNHSKDMRTGGHWSQTMHGPDGVDYPNYSKFLEVEKYKRIVYDHGAGKDLPPMFRVEVLLAEKDDRTRMDMTMTLPTAQAAANTRAFIKKAGGDATWDRLAEYLARQATGKELFVINRSFETSVDRMFDLWTDPDELLQWLPPTGFTMEFIKCDVLPGGRCFYVMSNAQNMKMYGTATYLELDRPGRIVSTQQFCDEHEKVTRHPMAPTWPETMLRTVTFAHENADRTRATVSWEPYGNVTSEEIETFANARAGMTQGWTGSFDKLEAHLANSMNRQ